MKKSRFSTEQIIGVLKEHEAGIKSVGPCAEARVADHTIYRWRSTYGGMNVSEAARLKQLEEENRKLKHVVAEQFLDIRVLKVTLGKNY